LTRNTQHIAIIARRVKWRQFEPEVILLAVGCTCPFSFSYRDVEELLAERGLRADHVTVWRWVQRYAPELERRLRRHLKPTNDFLLSAKRDAATGSVLSDQSLGR
jgi:transposase-like protein